MLLFRSKYTDLEPAVLCLTYLYGCQMPLFTHIQRLRPIHIDHAKTKAIFSLMYVLYSLTILLAFYLGVNRPLFTQTKTKETESTSLSHISLTMCNVLFTVSGSKY